MCKKIDIHTHILPDNIPNWMDKWGYGDFIRIEKINPSCANMIQGDKFFRQVDANCWDPKARLEDMQPTGVDIQVLSTVPVLFNYWAKPEHGHETSRFFNDHIASICNEYAYKFIGLGTLPMQDTDLALKELRRCHDELELEGVEIGSNINGENLDSERFYPLWEALEDLNMAVFIHPWEMMGTSEITKYWMPWLVGMPAETTRAICSLIFGGVMEKFPKLRFAMAHGGGNIAFTMGRIKHGFDVRPDLVAIDNEVSPEKYLGKFWVDSLVHDQASLQMLHDSLGSDRICLGSDYPFPLGEHHPGDLVESMPWDKEVKSKILWNNAFDWLGLNDKEFMSL